MRGVRAGVVTLAAVLALAAVSGCRREAKDQPTLGEKMDEGKDRWAIDSARMEADRAAAAAPSELAGSIWRLVQLQSSDDKVFTPEGKAVYTVEFGRDGQVSVVGGCNRGSGTWTSAPPSGLTFGPLATTRAMCPPGSMSARFLGDFQHMRSYQLVGGQLYISLMADGGIYQFAPEVDVATQFGGATDEPDVVFICTDSTGASSRIFASFSGTRPDTATLRRARKTTVVPQVPSASGAKYEGRGVLFWNKGRDAMVKWQGVNLNCATTKE